MNRTGRPNGTGAGADAGGADDRDLRDLEWLAGVMDDRFRIPGTRIRFGLDVLMGLVPVAGDTAGAAMSAYLFWRAARLGLPAHVLAAMAGNIALDWLLGLVPVAGDLLDLGFRANRRNLNLVRRHLARRRAADGQTGFRHRAAGGPAWRGFPAGGRGAGHRA